MPHEVHSLSLPANPVCFYRMSRVLTLDGVRDSVRDDLFAPWLNGIIQARRKKAFLVRLAGTRIAIPQSISLEKGFRCTTPNQTTRRLIL